MLCRNVLLQVAVCSEHLGASMAAEWMLTCVGASVNLQVCQTPVGFLAPGHFASVAREAEVAEIVVVYNILIPLEHALAIVMRADAPFGLLHMIFFMLIQMHFELKSFTAFLAQERPYVKLLMLSYCRNPYVTLKMNCQVRHGGSHLEATVPVLVDEGAHHSTFSIGLNNVRLSLSLQGQNEYPRRFLSKGNYNKCEQEKLSYLFVVGWQTCSGLALLRRYR